MSGNQGKTKDYGKRYRARLAEKGLCVDCRKPRVEGHVRCYDCGHKPHRQIDAICCVCNKSFKADKYNAKKNPDGLCCSPECRGKRVWQKRGNHIESRFWSKVNREPGQGPNGDCWEWTAGRTGGKKLKWEKQYGQFGQPNGTPTRAHVYSYILHYGPIPKGLQICHGCHNPPCVNPAHLSIGTAKYNATQSKLKRWRENPPPEPESKGQWVKINQAQCEIIRLARITNDIKQASLAVLAETDYTAYSRFEKGQRGIRLEKLQFILRYLNISDDTFNLQSEQIEEKGKQTIQVGKLTERQRQAAKPIRERRAWLKLPEPNTQKYRADLLVEKLKEFSFSEIQAATRVSISSQKNIYAGTSNRLQGVFKLAKFAGIPINEIWTDFNLVSQAYDQTYANTPTKTVALEKTGKRGRPRTKLSRVELMELAYWDLGII